MSKKRFPEGMIVRKKNQFDVPIGPYMIVVCSNAKFVTTCTVGTIEPTRTIMKDNIYIVRIARLCASPEVIKDILCGFKTVVQHPTCKTWLDACENVPDLIMFYSMNGYSKVYVTVDLIERKRQLHSDIVRVYINKVIL